jgi:hypothetical protein
MQRIISMKILLHLPPAYSSAKSSSQNVLRQSFGNLPSCARTTTPHSSGCCLASATPTTPTRQTPLNFLRHLILPKSHFGRLSGAPPPTPYMRFAPKDKANAPMDVLFR